MGRGGEGRDGERRVVERQKGVKSENWEGEGRSIELMCPLPWNPPGHLWCMWGTLDCHWTACTCVLR